MRAEPLFLRAALEWAGIAAAVGPASDDRLAATARGMPRELAWCHLLAAAGRPDAALVRLRAVVRHATGSDPPAGGGDAVRGAADLLDRLRRTVLARHPSARPHRPTAMCTAVALPLSELPDDVLADLSGRVHTRGGEKEVRFDWRACPALLPVWWHGRLRVVRWGNRDRAERRLPPTGWTWKASVEEGKWAALEPEPVLVPARYAYAGGVWFAVKEGVSGLVVRTRAGEPAVYLVTEPATRYYRVMTRADWMPSLVGEVI